MLKDPTLLVWDTRLEEKDRSKINEINETLDRLAIWRVVQINRAGHFDRSKLAWKVGVYQQVLLHRIVSLADGAAVAWNSRTTLSAFLCTRALVETIALLYHLRQAVDKFLTDELVGDLNAVAEHGLYSSRNPEWVSEFPNLKAKSVLTFIDKLDKYLPGVRGHYDRLSERCHPNSLGHNYMFSKLDRSIGSVAFYDEREPAGNAVSIFAGLRLLKLADSIIPQMTEDLVKVADIHHRISPSPM
jgi:hypothetical protein